MTGTVWKLPGSSSKIVNRVGIDQVPENLINALTSTEDSRFFEHEGVDYVGIARAMKLNLQKGEVHQGASTITQQLARNAFDLKTEFLDKDGRERGLDRKLVEAFLAMRLDEQYSKRHILELYLNHIYFGSGYWGIQSAAQGYFGKDVSQLNLEECATIVGLIKSPERLSPFIDETRSIESRNYVFFRMMEEKKITPEQWAELKLKPMVLAKRTASTRKGYVYEEVRQQAGKLLGDGTAVGGYQIYTTIDSGLQRVAEAAILNELSNVEAEPGYGHQTYDQFRQMLTDFEKQSNPDLPPPEPTYLQGALCYPSTIPMAP
jgi:membrane carboxypeptidase/penicillin-binding protein